MHPLQHYLVAFNPAAPHPAATLPCCPHSSSIAPSYNLDQLQHYLATLTPAAPNPASILTNCSITLLPSIQ
nr:hypothetical protein CFP56_40371 [Quercus suber]